MSSSSGIDLTRHVILHCGQLSHKLRVYPRSILVDKCRPILESFLHFMIHKIFATQNKFLIEYPIHTQCENFQDLPFFKIQCTNSHSTCNLKNFMDFVFLVLNRLLRLPFALTLRLKQLSE